MTNTGSGILARLRQTLAPALAGPAMLAFLPALTLATFWLGGETALLAVALGLPVLIAAAGGFSKRGNTVPRDAVTGMILRDGFEQEAARIHTECSEGGLRSAIFVLELDDYKELTDRHGQEAGDRIMQHCGAQIVSALRQNDIIARIGDSRFAVCLAPTLQLDLELCIQLAGRMQSATEEPVALDGTTLYMTSSLGFCQHNRAPGSTSAEWNNAAIAALSEAQSNGPGGIRAYSADMPGHASSRSSLRDEAAAALETGQIQAWFQPQICTDTGRVSGFEALARWLHPVQGLIPPSTFLPALEEAGLMDRLSQVMLYNALVAIRAWDEAGVKVPCVGVNFATQELRNPGLAGRVKWELERFGLPADRLCVEILETVMTDQPDDVVTRNILSLSEMGCPIDLDDFGTGHASISAVRRFNISRIKIDRSFVMKADQDPEQQKLISAILTMAERLELETLAEGVETAGEHALLAQLGCGHVQGFGIGRPMPFDQTLDWIAAHEAKLQDAPAIGRQTP
ncbi:putative bifunctional diguanylate cyclase/phosphodiesterase [Leisingera sp. ANG-DT]|uniref:putative bifunctional diguanylate cyclase/phosphodiesterase n=1 Tax=Leisingera sp. ANG-DT TaxID=1577897 RepID=UPI00057F0023|nr:bifunctional diguanylate cyclase/phosphodiesterase [Leisingera sp. ANG-DT]KIC15276.1 diguanylate cyclase [Leisingera sp. ANG-DT]